MGKAHLETGKFGEKIAKEYLISKGFVVIECNWRHRHKEIDLICKEGDTTVFVEVKTRRSTKFGMPENGLSDKKMSLLIAAADEYLQEHPNLDIRFDLIAILLKGDKVEDLFHSRDVYL